MMALEPLHGNSMVAEIQRLPFSQQPHVFDGFITVVYGYSNGIHSCIQEFEELKTGFRAIAVDRSSGWRWP
jgi:hypothetical protein